MKYTINHFLILLFALAASVGYAQQTTDDDKQPDKKTVKKIMDWVTVFTMYSDVDISDKVDLKEYAEAADILQSFVTNAELSVKIAQFKRASFVNVYPKGMLLGDEWILKKLNEVSEAQYSSLNAPYITTEVWFKPNAETTNYTVSILLKTAHDKLRPWVTEVNTTINATLTAQTFERPRDAKEAVNKALFAGLDQLKILIGSSLAPNIAIRYNDEMYLNDQTIEVWQKAAGAIDLVAVDKDNNSLTGPVTWTNARSNGTAVAQYLVSETGLNRVTIKFGADQISVLMKVKEFSIDPEAILKALLIEVMNEKIAEARQKIADMKNDSSSVQTQIAQAKLELDTRAGLTEAVVIDSDVTIETLEIEDDVREGTASELAAIKQDPLNNKYIELYRKRIIMIADALLQIQIEVFLADLINNPAKLKVYGQTIRDNSPQLIGQLIIKIVQNPNDKSGLKDIVIDFLNKEINAVAAK